LPALIPVNVVDPLLQLIMPLPEVVTVGAVVFDVTFTVDVLVHPLVVLVAVTVYVPAAPTVAGLAAFVNVPPFQTIVFPALVPVKVAFAAVQEMFPELTEVTVGRVVLLVTFTVEVFVQPLVAFVAVTV
jgi:hypothetical protein